MNLCAYKKVWPVHQFFLREGSFCFSTKKSFWLHCHRAGSASSWCNKWSCFISLISQLSSCLHISSSRPVSCSVVMCYRSFAHWACSLPLCQPWIYTLAMVGFKQKQRKKLLPSWLSSGYKVGVALWLFVWHMHAPILSGYVSKKPFKYKLIQYQYCYKSQGWNASGNTYHVRKEVFATFHHLCIHPNKWHTRHSNHPLIWMQKHFVS